VRGVMLVTVATLIGVAVWPRSRPTSQHGAAAASYWNLELSSAGTKPVTALVFGDEAGVHLVQLPGSGASAEERQRVPVRLGSGDVYMMSMGWSGLDVRTSSPAGSAPMSFGAQARFVKLFKSANGTGIQTSWR
jgi:hypothetical protein